MVFFPILLIFFGFTSAQVWIPKREPGFIFNRDSINAPIRIDAFLDLLCPDSKRAYNALRPLAEKYGPAVIQLRVHMFPLPYHMNAYNAGKGAFAVDSLSGGSKTFDWFDSVFDNIGSFTNSKTHTLTGAQVLSNFDYLAKTLGLKKGSFQSLMIANKTLELETRLAWKYGCTRAIHSTPMVLVNDILLSSQRPEQLTIDDWSNIVEPLLK